MYLNPRAPYGAVDIRRIGSLDARNGRLLQSSYILQVPRLCSEIVLLLDWLRRE